MSLGRSKLITCFTLEMSRPRAATWVHKTRAEIISIFDQYFLLMLCITNNVTVSLPIFTRIYLITYYNMIRVWARFYLYWPLWQPEWGIFLIWTGSGPPLCLSGSGRHGYWCRRSPPDTRSPPRRLHLSWSPQKPESTSPYLVNREKRHLRLNIKRWADNHGAATQTADFKLLRMKKLQGFSVFKPQILNIAML